MSLLRQIGVLTLCFAAILVVGCENEHPANIPGDAMLNSEGNGLLAATAPHDGTVYIYDVNGDRVVYSGAVAKGQVVTLNTDQNKITVDGQVRADRILNQSDKHRIYFDDSPVVVREHVIIEETPVTVAPKPGI